MKNIKGVGERIKWLREHLEMSGSELGLRIGLPQTKIADLEREKTRLSLGVMEAFERELDVSREWLMEGVGAWKKSEAIKAFEGGLKAIHDATQAAVSLGLNDEDGRRLQELIVGLRRGDKTMVERALHAMQPDEAALLDNYRHCSDEARDTIKKTSHLLAQCPTKKRITGANG